MPFSDNKAQCMSCKGTTFQIDRTSMKFTFCEVTSGGIDTLNILIYLEYIRLDSYISNNMQYAFQFMTDKNTFSR